MRFLEACCAYYYNNFDIVERFQHFDC